MYKELRKVLKKAYPNHKGKWSIIEDNDPTGYKSRVGFAAKKEARPKRVAGEPPLPPGSAPGNSPN